VRVRVREREGEGEGEGEGEREREREKEASKRLSDQFVTSCSCIGRSSGETADFPCRNLPEGGRGNCEAEFCLNTFRAEKRFKLTS
jgi:hypothetical protein